MYRGRPLGWVKDCRLIPHTSRWTTFWGEDQGIDQIGDLLKGKERDRQRQDNCLQREATADQCVQVIDKEVGVFEVAQQSEVDDNPRSK